MIIFDVPLWQILSLLAGTVLPLLVGLVTTRATNPGAKALLLAALAVATNLATELASALQYGERYNLGMALLLGLATFLIAVGTHYGFWKPTGVTEKAQQSLRTRDTISGQLAFDEDQVLDRSPSNQDRVPGPDHRI